jgi:uncharacterized protein YchJ
MAAAMAEAVVKAEAGATSKMEATMRVVAMAMVRQTVAWVERRVGPAKAAEPKVAEVRAVKTGAMMVGVTAVGKAQATAVAELAAEWQEAACEVETEAKTEAEGWASVRAAVAS